MKPDVSQMLLEIEQGDAAASERLMVAVYDELRGMAAERMARERPGQTLQATALVHEVFVRMAGDLAAAKFASRRHFFAAASRAMRQVLVDAARRKLAHRHGGEMARAEIDVAHLPSLASRDPAETLALHELLETLAREHPRRAEVVQLRCFADCTFDEIGQILEISPDAARDDWVIARAWLNRAWTRSRTERE